MAPIEVTEEAKARAEALKTEANALFSANKYLQAIEKYTEAIALNPNVAVYYSNRSLAYFKAEFYGYAIEDANAAIAIDPSFVKAYYRRASANMALLKYKEALRDLRSVCKVIPNDKDASRKLAEVEKIVKRIAFEKAIEAEETVRSAFDSLDVDSIIVEPQYDGPRFDGDTITREFVLEMLQRFKQQKTIHRKYAYKILFQVKALLASLPTMVEIPVPADGKITVCGDTHGQFYDVMNLFEVNGMPSETNPYLFNGDFVDRGSFSVEVMFTMFAFKLLLPNHYHLTRGNHESINMNKMYGFEGEVKHKFSELMFNAVTEIFNCLPLCALIANRVFVVHGGLFSRDDVTLDDIRAIDRFRQPADEGLMAEMLWADPMPLPGRRPSKRGVALEFGPDVTDAFCKRNNLAYIIRSHEVKDNGYAVDHNGKCITVFSAPNYCDQMGNKGAYVTIKGDKVDEPILNTFEAVPHPDIRPMAYASSFGMPGGF